MSGVAAGGVFCATGVGVLDVADSTVAWLMRARSVPACVDFSCVDLFMVVVSSSRGGISGVGSGTVSAVSASRSLGGPVWSCFSTATGCGVGGGAAVTGGARFLSGAFAG